MIGLGQSARVCVRTVGAERVNVYAYTLPNRVYRLVRSGSSASTLPCWNVRPAADTRLYAVPASGLAGRNSASAVLKVVKPVTKPPPAPPSTPSRPTPVAPPAPRPVPRPAATSYANCDALNQVYPSGVAQSASAVDSTSGRPVTNFAVDAAVYDRNTRLDRDKDLIACEKR